MKTAVSDALSKSVLAARNIQAIRVIIRIGAISKGTNLGEVISILKAKKSKKTDKQNDGFTFEGYGESKSVPIDLRGRPLSPEDFGRHLGPQPETFQDRVARIRRSLESINRLMKELKKVSQKEEGDETK